MSSDLNDVIDEEFQTPLKFSMMIEEEANRRNITLVEFVVEFCEERMIDPEEIKHLFSRSVRDKMEVEFQQMNYLEKSPSLEDL